MADYTDFLKNVEKLSEIYASIYFNCELEALTMPFWSWQKIQSALVQRTEWEVDDSLIPFYGDWHDLFCLNENSGEIVALNDERKVLCTWESTDIFLSCLSETELTYDDNTGSEVYYFGSPQSHEIKH